MAVASQLHIRFRTNQGLTALLSQLSQIQRLVITRIGTCRQGLSRSWQHLGGLHARFMRARYVVYSTTVTIFFFRAAL